MGGCTWAWEIFINMKIYQTKTRRFTGTRYDDIYDKAFCFHLLIKKKSKRRPYIRSAYFSKEKIFLDLFWRHLHQKNWRDRARRLRYFASAIELICWTRFDPISKQNPNKNSEIFHRFEGVTSDNYRFIVQIKEDKRTGQKHLLSVFPKP